MKRTRNDVLAILLALLMTASTLSGCSGSVDGPDDGDQGELEDWNVFHVQSASDLPVCDADTDGRLYYLSSDSEFRACSGGTWSTIDLTGPSGPAGEQGPPGSDGQDGAQGPAGPVGTQGPAGPVGADGTSFTVVGTVEENSDLGEIYIGEIGDAFLVNSTVHIHVWSGSEWIDLGNISGPEGADGADGSDGQDGAQGPAGPAGADGADGSDGSLPSVMDVEVTVSMMKFYMEGIQQGEVTLYRGFTYTFGQSASSNSPHPLRLSTSSDGTHGGGSEYTNGVTYSGTQGSDGVLTFTVPMDAPDTLYYYCANHANMGGTIQIVSLGSVS